MNYLSTVSKLNSAYSFQKTNNIDLDDQVSLVENKKDFKEFFHIPFTIYQKNPYWVPPFWKEFNDFFHSSNPFRNHAETALFIAYKNNQPVGRIAAIIDHLYCKNIGRNIGFFGFFECINDFAIAKKLFYNAEKWVSSKKMSILQGPIDGRIDNGCGFLYQGFNIQPSLLSTYSPKYYLTFAEKYKMKKIRDQFSYYIDLTKPLPTQLQKKAHQSAQSGVRIRRFNRFRTNKELNWWINLFLETFAHHWGYVPVSAKEVKSRFGINQMRWIVDPNLFLIAEINNEPVAYLWATPDYNQLFKKMNGKLTLPNMLKFINKKKQITTGKLHLVGIKKNARHQHIASYLNYESLKEMQKRGYQGAEVGWIDEKNTIAHKTIAITEARAYKKSRVFEKKIQTDKQETDHL
mgnify:CR=1 FL=1